MRKILIAICILFLIQTSIPTYAQIENPQEFVEVEIESSEEQSSVTDTQTDEAILKPTVSPLLVLFSFFAISIFLSLGYLLIKKFNL